MELNEKFNKVDIEGNMKRLLEYVENKNILITGGTGSFGRMMTNVLLQSNAKKIIILSRHEDLQVNMRREFTDRRIEFFIGDVRDYERCLEVTKNVDIIFHAAALKQVSEIERHPMEAVKTNIMGTYNIKRAAIFNNVEHVVGISTDKAVKPINVYGMTKAIDERILLNKEIETSTKFSVVRYGNIVGSRGSVIQYWYELARKGLDLPLTDERMTRFWLTLQDAIELVLFSLKESGKLVVRKCKSFSLLDLSNIYKEAYGVKVKIIGIRVGEKLHECLLTDYEMRKAELIEDKFYVVDLSSEDKTKYAEDYTSDKAEKIKREEMKEILKDEGFL